MRELLEKRAEYIDRAKALLNKAKAEGRDFRPEEAAEFERLMVKAESISDTLADGLADAISRAREGRDLGDFAEIDALMDQPATPPYRPKGTRSAGTGFYARLFPRVPVSTDGFKDWDDFASAVLSLRHDPRLTAVATHLSGVGSTGGFAVPTKFAQELLEEVLQESILLGRVRTVGLDAIKVETPAWDDLNQSDGSVYGGFKAVWSGEDVENTEQTAKLRMVNLTAHKLSLYTSLTRELAYFSRPDFGAELKRALREALTFGLDTALLTGDGVGKPLGVVNCPSAITVHRAMAGKVQYVDVAAMLGRLHPRALASDAIWTAHPSILPQLLTMKDDAGNLIWVPSARDGEPDRLLNRPIYYNDRMANLGGKGDLVLFAPRFYIAGLAPQIWIDVSEAPHWFKDRIALRAITFCDGLSAWDKPYTPPSGDPLSWAVILDVPAA